MLGATFGFSLPWRTLVGTVDLDHAAKLGAPAIQTDEGLMVTQRAYPGTREPHRAPSYASVTVMLRTDSRTTMRSPEVAPWASKRTFESVSSTSSMPWTVA